MNIKTKLSIISVWVAFITLITYPNEIKNLILFLIGWEFISCIFMVIGLIALIFLIFIYISEKIYNSELLFFDLKRKK